MGWRETQEVEILFLMRVLAQDYYRLEQVKSLPITIKFYDNKGNLIRNTDEGSPIETQITLDLGVKRFHTLPDGSRQEVPPPK